MKYKEQTSIKWEDRNPYIYFGIDGFDIPAEKINLCTKNLFNRDIIVPEENATTEVSLCYREEENRFNLVSMNKNHYLTEKDLQKPFISYKDYEERVKKFKNEK